MDKEFIDLGLPSGRLWCAENEEGFYTFDEAVAEFNEHLPTKADFDELMTYTYHKWDSEKNGMVFYSLSSDNSVFFPAHGCRHDFLDSFGLIGDYWSSTPYDKFDAFDLFFTSYYVRMFAGSRDFGFLVRLVR